MKKYPNFLCVGAQKAGTTTLHDILKQHPDIYLPELKEAHFFDQEERYAKGIVWWVETFFSAYKDEKIMGAITPEYLYFDKVPDRIRSDLGSDIKILIILRNPVKRAYSHYLMSLRKGLENLPFEEAIVKEPERISKDDFSRNHFSYIDRGRYSRQINRYMDKFGRKNILFLSFEKNITKNLTNTIKKIEEFLDVREISLRTNLISNEASKPKYRKVNDIVYKNNIIKKILKIFIVSNRNRIKLAQFIDKINQNKMPNQALSSEIEQEMMDKYFAGDIEEVSKVTDIDFSYWSNTVSNEIIKDKK